MDGGFFLIMAAMPFRVLDLGGDSLALGVTAAVGAVAYILAAPVAGRLSDRHDRRRLAAWGAGSLTACAIAAWLAPVLWLLIALQVLMGLGKALYWPPVQATVGDLTPLHRRGPVLGRFNLAWSVGKGLGFVLGGLLLAHAGFDAAFLAGAAAVVAAAVLLPRRRVRGGEAAPEPSAPSDASGTRLPAAFLGQAWLANTGAYSAFGILTYHLPQWFAQRDWPADRYGWFLGAILGAQTLMFLWLGLGRRRDWSPWRLWGPQLACLAAVAVLPIWHSFGLLLLTAPVVGAGCGVSYHASLVASLHEASGRGRRAGIHEGLIGAGGFAPPLLAGLLVRGGLPLASPYVLAAALIGLALVGQVVVWRRALSRP